MSSNPYRAPSPPPEDERAPGPRWGATRFRKLAVRVLRVLPFGPALNWSFDRLERRRASAIRRFDRRRAEHNLEQERLKAARGERLDAVQKKLVERLDAHGDATIARLAELVEQGDASRERLDAELALIEKDTVAHLVEQGFAPETAATFARSIKALALLAAEWSSP